LKQPAAAASIKIKSAGERIEPMQRALQVAVVVRKPLLHSLNGGFAIGRRDQVRPAFPSVHGERIEALAESSARSFTQR
jgi:hypothetical protein